MTTNTLRTRLSGKKWWLIAIVLLVAALVGYRFYANKNATAGGARSGRSGQSAQSPAVAFVHVSRQDVPVEVNALGSVSALQTVNIYAKVEGDLTQVHFKEGQAVKAGDVLFSIDPRAYQANLQQAQGTLQANQANLTNAQLDLQRYQNLVKEDSVAKQKLDTQSALVRQYAGTVTSNQAAVAAAQLQVGYTRITAPISGRIGLKTVDVGAHILPNSTTALTSIVKTDPMLVLFSLPDRYLADVVAARGSSLTVEAWDHDNKNRLAVGTLTAFDNQIDSSTNTFKLKASFSGSSGQLYPNQFVNIHLTLKVLPQAVVVPQAAVQTGTNGKFVWVLDDADKVHHRDVTVGPQQGESVVITANLNDGERVVVDGLDRLLEGLAVRPSEKGTKAAPDAAAADNGQKHPHASNNAPAQ